MAPFFSVIIPVYNKKNFVARAIDSVIAQSFGDFEVIIVDDGSTDGSAEIIESVSDHRVRVLHRKLPGPGGYAARNLGVREARGPWICFLDADDEWLSVNLEKTHALIKQFPECSMFSCDWYDEAAVLRRHLGDGYFNSHDYRILKIGDYFRSAIQEVRPTCSNVVCFRRSLGRDGDVFPEGKTSRTGDIYAWARLVVNAGGLVVGNHVGALCRTDTENRVSQSSFGDPRFFVSIHKLDQLKTLNPSEKLLIYKYGNRLINYVLKQSGYRGWWPWSVWSLLQPKSDLGYCVTVSITSILPSTAFNSIRKIVRWVKKLKALSLLKTR